MTSPDDPNAQGVEASSDVRKFARTPLVRATERYLSGGSQWRNISPTWSSCDCDRESNPTLITDCAGPPTSSTSTLRPLIRTSNVSAVPHGELQLTKFDGPHRIEPKRSSSDFDTAEAALHEVDRATHPREGEFPR